MNIPIPGGIKGLIFDLDGTLADTMPVHVAAWKLAAASFGVVIEDQMIYNRSGMPTVKVAELLNKDYGWTLDPVLVKQAKDKAYHELKPQIGVRPIDPIFQIANEYRGKLPMAIGTGSSRPNAENTLISLGIMDWFDIVITANDVENHKPHPETYLKCASLLGLQASDCVVFEDAEFGIIAARDAGMEVIDVRNYL
ncbi:MAG: beta-phosphoglucomutase family hydrolase [Bacteroidia bacterium]|nr:beta-phosphoglucomutase family hydrolase [Bacteroidia bacterium]